MKWAAMLAAALLCVGCAKSADKIAAAYVSPLSYEQYSCQQIGMEAERISARVMQVTGAQNQKATNDAVATTVGIVIFWPALFFIGGDDATSYELARLKGEMEAVEKVSIAKSCGIEFRHEPEPEVKPAREKSS